MIMSFRKKAVTEWPSALARQTQSLGARCAQAICISAESAGAATREALSAWVGSRLRDSCRYVSCALPASPSAVTYHIWYASSVSMCMQHKALSAEAVCRCPAACAHSSVFMPSCLCLHASAFMPLSHASVACLCRTPLIEGCSSDLLRSPPIS